MGKFFFFFLISFVFKKILKKNFVLFCIFFIVYFTLLRKIKTILKIMVINLN